jgi:histone-lysine N-methyltransferase SETMAR
MIAEALHISTSTVHAILHEQLQLSKVCARWVPKSLSMFDKHRRVTASKELLSLYQHDPNEFETRFITGDETWVYDYQPESKQQSMVWVKKGSPAPVKFKSARSAGKSMATIFWDCQGAVLIDFLPRGTTMTGQYYAALLGRLREAVKKERRGKLSRGVLLLHDNAPPHTSHFSTSAIYECGFEILQHPPYSPDLAPSDFHLFANLKKALGGSRFLDEIEARTFVTEWLNEQTHDFYLHGIRALLKRLQKCIDINGDYVEKL